MPKNHTPLLEANDATLVLRGKRVLDEVGLEVQDGQCVAVCGPSGSGKTTLLRAVAGLIPLTAGRILLDGRPRSGPGFKDCGKGEVGMVFQGEQLYGHMSLLDNVTLAPRKVLHQPKEEAERAARELLRKVGLEGKESMRPCHLSGGERQRGAIARAMALRPRLMLFDEPTSALDASCVKEVLALIRAVREEGQAMLLVTHQIPFARSLADAIIFMEGGKIAAEETPEGSLLRGKGETARSLCKDSLPEISALDRVKLRRSLLVAVATPLEIPEAGDFRTLPLAAAANALSCSLSFTRLPQGADGATFLKAGLADALLLPEGEGREGLSRLGQDGACMLASDFLWKKFLAPFIKTEGATPPSQP